jgi:hypothetical protein
MANRNPPEILLQALPIISCHFDISHPVSSFSPHYSPLSKCHTGPPSSAPDSPSFPATCCLTNPTRGALSAPRRHDKETSKDPSRVSTRLSFDEFSLAAKLLLFSTYVCRIPPQRQRIQQRGMALFAGTRPLRKARTCVSAVSRKSDSPSEDVALQRFFPILHTVLGELCSRR